MGVSHQVWSALCYRILKYKCTIYPPTTVQHVTIDKLKDLAVSDKVKANTNTLDGEFSVTKYISTESEFEGFIVND